MLLATLLMLMPTSIFAQDITGQWNGVLTKGSHSGTFAYWNQRCTGAGKDESSAYQKRLEEAGNKHYTIKELEGVNHMFQVRETGSMSEYSKCFTIGFGRNNPMDKGSY